MTRRQQIIILLLFFMLSSAVLATAISGNVLGQMTIPTRTPTPDPDDPTDPPPEPTDDNGDDNPPGATDVPPTNPPPSSNATNTPIPPGTPETTSTPLPGPTVSSTPTASPVGGVVTTTATELVSETSTPFGGVLAPGTTPVSFPVVATAFPTAQICGEPPTFTTLITSLVYSGPGNEYEFVETLAADETRPIVGRAIYESWWLIQLDGKFNQAWINDRTGIVQGNTANVPEVPAPAIDGTTPTPGVRWDPTPVYDCELTPTSTATGSAGEAASGTTNEDGQDSIAQPDSERDQRSLIAATAAPLDIPSSAPTPNLLPIAGLVLIIAAVFVALFLRRNPGGGEPSA
jgi:hypothetical protein